MNHSFKRNIFHHCLLAFSINSTFSFPNKTLSNAIPYSCFKWLELHRRAKVKIWIFDFLIVNNFYVSSLSSSNYFI